MPCSIIKGKETKSWKRWWKENVQEHNKWWLEGKKREIREIIDRMIANA